MSSLFISDIHLRPDDVQRIDSLIHLLENEAKQYNQLYILGDLFNTWLGDDIVAEPFLKIIDALSTLSQSGVQCFLMVGNRDFMIKDDFSQRCGCQLLSDPTVIELDGHEILLSHGDNMCTDDVSYQRYRRWINNKLLQRLFLSLPSSYRQKISDKIKQKSREQKQNKSVMIMDVNDNAVDEMMQQYQVDYLLHGHTHRPAIHTLSKNRYRIVLGDWDEKPSYLSYRDKQFKLHDKRVLSHTYHLNLS